MSCIELEQAVFAIRTFNYDALCKPYLPLVYSSYAITLTELLLSVRSSTAMGDMSSVAQVAETRRMPANELTPRRQKAC